MQRRVLSFIRSVAFLRRWRDDTGGNYAVIFALSLIPILVAAGAAIDISQAFVVKQRLTRALDDAGLAIGGMTGLTAAQMQTNAQAYFDANYPASKIGVPGTVSVSASGNVVNLTVTATMPTSIMGIVGIDTLDISASSQITKMGKKLEVALVLDNTGSMSSNSKLTTLKTAAKNLIATVSASAVTTGDVKIAVVPFTIDVNVGSTYKSATWLKWTWDLPTQTCTTKTSGSGANKTTTTTCTQDTRTVSTSGWAGCVTDRDQSYDIAVTLPSTSNTATLYPADNSNTYNNSCSLQKLAPLTTDWTSLNTEIDAMAAGGATNTTIGLVWGWQMLTQGATLSNAAAADSTKLNKVLVFLTDGDNTYYRGGIGTCDGSNDCAGADARTALVCTAIKNAGIQVYTVRVMDGNETLLKNCASDSTMYFSVTAASQLTTVFASIAQSLSNLRISQ